MSKKSLHSDNKERTFLISDTGIHFKVVLELRGPIEITQGPFLALRPYVAHRLVYNVRPATARGIIVPYYSIN